MCIYFLLGNCKFGSSACVYAHDKTYLPTGRWWEKEKKRLAIQFLLDSLDLDDIPVSMPYILGLIDNRIAWATAHGIEVERLFEPLGTHSLETFRGIIDIGLTTAEEGMDVNSDGFTEGEEMELLSVKTWDDDPWVSVPVLDAGFVPLLSAALLIPLFRLFVTRSILSDVVSIFIAFISCPRSHCSM